jgi:hypothetical protein
VSAEESPTPGDDLPFVDEHAVDVDAPAAAVWAAVLDVDRRFSGRVVEVYARAVGCADVRAAGPRPLAAGSTLPGFHVAAATPPSELELAGSHRFSTYTLTFRIDDLGPGRSRLRAESRAAFPGRGGAAYRALVIGTRGHVVATRRLLAGLARAAEGRAG